VEPFLDYAQSYHCKFTHVLYNGPSDTLRQLLRSFPESGKFAEPKHVGELCY
jgi:hypothetical protein